MSKTEQNIEIAQLAVELLKAMQHSSSNRCYEGISEATDVLYPPIIDVFDALYNRLKAQLTED